MGNFLDFQLIKQEVPFSDAIDLLDLKLKLAGNIFRGPCPCGRGDTRALVITPDKGWYCQGAKVGGDVIGLAKHTLDLASMRDAAFELADRAGISTGSTSTVPGNGSRPRQEPESERGKINPRRPREAGRQSSASHPFDPEAFWAKCQYTDEVAELGITEEEAELLLIGFYRGKLYQALRYANGQVAGFSAFANGELKLPASLLPMSNIVPLKKRA